MKKKTKKKIRDEEYEVTPKKKVKKKNTEIELPDELKSLKAKLKGLPPTEKEYADEYIWMFNRIGKLIRIYEKKARKGSSRDIYALNHLISQQREVIYDLRTMADATVQVDMVVNNIVRPLITEMGQVILNSYHQLKTLMTKTSDKKELKFALSNLDNIVKEQSSFLQKQFQDSAALAHSVLIGEPDKAKPKKKKKFN